MRIRKRFPLSSIYLSDPQSTPPPAVQQHQKSGTLQPHRCGNHDAAAAASRSEDSPNYPPPPPADRDPTIEAENTRWMSSSLCTNDEQALTKQKKLEGEEEVKNETWRRDQEVKRTNIGSSNDTSRKEWTVDIGVALKPSVSSRQDDKVVPLKKRRTSFERGSVSEEEEEEEDENEGENNNEMMKPNYMKSKANKKCGINAPIGEEEEVKDEVHDIFQKNATNSSTRFKKGKRGGSGGGVILEGSRCSRVNGRGWRCCQQTLVGYSLCEHHLGKGRLRTMTSVRSRARAVVANTSAIIVPNKDEPESLSISLPLVQEKQEGKRVLLDDNIDDDDDDTKNVKLPLKVRLGMVKARSISSLLGQTSSL